MALVDTIEPSAAAIDSVNTIVNTDGHLSASNTDFEAIATLIGRHELDPSANVLVRGSGGMAKAVVAAFRDAGFENLTVLARNIAAGGALAQKYGYAFIDADPEPGHQVLVNVTPLGMDGEQAAIQSFSDAQIAAAETVFDVVAFPSETPLVAAAREHGKQVITGAEVIALQAAAQFEKYTGHGLSEDQVVRASEFSRQ